jgi:hypothetical protein
MKLKPDETVKLIAAIGGRSVDSLIDDACELLTAKIVLRIQAKRKKLVAARKALPLGDPKANDLARQIEILGQLTVELAEAE